MDRIREREGKKNAENQKGKLQEDYDAFPSSLEGNNKDYGEREEATKILAAGKILFFIFGSLKNR